MTHFFSVALPTPMRCSFEYTAPEPLDASRSNILPGCRVLVPFGKQTLVGVVVAVADTASYAVEKLKAIIEVLDTKPILSSEVLQLCQWTSDYYQHPLGEVLHAALPIQLRKPEGSAELPAERWWRHTHEGKGLPESALRNGSKQQKLHQLLLQRGSLRETELLSAGISQAVLKALEQKDLICHFRQTLDAPSHSADCLLAQAPIELNQEQQVALAEIRHHRYGAYLLDGTTGSGKTEVYLHAIARTLQAGKQALILVPEIGLTPQTVARFQNRFQVPIVQLHSNVSHGQRTQNWIAATAGRARIVIGTRLAIFTPMPELGIIIIDEEHDLSFKQQDGLRYSARDLAVMRAFRLNIPLLLGSATPSLESLYNAQQHRYTHLHLTQRAGDAQAPQIHCVDMRKEPSGTALSATATAAMARALERGEQVLVFINRRGYAPALICHTCGWSAACKACDARLTVHNFPKRLRCHHCGLQKPVPQSCPSCHNPELNAQGQGTERCELTLQHMFPKVEVIRVDQDSMQAKNAMGKLTEKVLRGEPCVLVGTQMLAKGHHFPKVTVAVLIDIDQGLFSGDFRGPERMGQQIIQVAGRAGRAHLPGLVLLQTYQPDHPLLQCLIHDGYHTFAHALLQERLATRLPPTAHMAVFRAESKRQENAIDFLKLVAQRARQLQPPTPSHRYLGPIPALQEKRNERFRFQLQLCFANRAELQMLLFNLIQELAKHALAQRTRWSIDVDPQDMA